MNISKLLKRVLLSFMFHAADDDGGGPSLEAMFEERDGGGEQDDGQSAGAGEGGADDELDLTGGEDIEGDEGTPTVSSKTRRPHLRSAR